MTAAGVIGIGRHRIGVDGLGVTTLVAFHGCTLNCKYCLNPNSIDSSAARKTYTPQLLYDEVKKDALYFLATGGGITFGGGEPCLRHEFIRSFRDICGTDWKLNIETALNVPEMCVDALIPVIDHWIVDIKDMNPVIYKAYTGKDDTLPLNNLKRIIAAGAKITVRVPLITGYNKPEDVEESCRHLMGMGITDIERFTYTLR